MKNISEIHGFKHIYRRFLTKKWVVNNGHAPQYYVKNNYETIILREIYLQVQEEIMRRTNIRNGKTEKIGTESFTEIKIYLSDFLWIERGRAKESSKWYNLWNRSTGGELCLSPILFIRGLTHCFQNNYEAVVYAEKSIEKGNVKRWFETYTFRQETYKIYRN